MPKLTIDGMEVEVAAGTSVLQAAEQLGVEVPRFCYHDKLSVPANCRMCLVEIEGGPPKPVASCAMPCADGMKVHTQSAMAKKARKGVMEMLLINHPLDCPICDQGGECDLQDQAVAYGYDRSRYEEPKRAVTDKELGPLIKTVMTRCIQCTRCVRFADEIAGCNDIGVLNRGEELEIGTYVQQAVRSELSGNLIDVCPVGALTSKPYAFTARPWELRKTESIDVHDAVGSNIRIDVRSGQVLRILPRLNEDVNEEWISDKTRFAVDGLVNQRLDRPYVRREGRLQEASWEEAFAAIHTALSKVSGDKIAALVGDLADCESIVALKDLMTALGSSNTECRVNGAVYDVHSTPAAWRFNTTIAGIEQADAILLVGTNPRGEAALINARIRKSWLANRVPVGLIGAAADLNYPYRHIGDDISTLQELAQGKGDFATVLAQAERPMIIVGEGAFCREEGVALHGLVHAIADKFAMVKEGWNGFNMLHTAAARVGALELGFAMREKLDLAAMQVVYLLGADDVDFKALENAFVIYQGHHGDTGALHADVILPGSAYTEKTATYVNTEGRAQRARQAVFAPGQAREDWKILRALSETLGCTLPYDRYSQIQDRLAQASTVFAQVGEVVLSPWDKFGAMGNVSGKFVSAIDNFYMTNVICRASKVMADCTKEFGEAA